MVIEAQSDSEDRDVSLKRLDLQQGDYVVCEVHTIRVVPNTILAKIPARTNRMQHIWNYIPRSPAREDKQTLVHVSRQGRH